MTTEFKIVHVIVTVLLINPVIRFVPYAFGPPPPSFSFNSLRGVFYSPDILLLYTYGGLHLDPEMLNKNGMSSGTILVYAIL